MACVRRVDSVSRFGGEEFCVILPQTNEEGAKETSQKLCAAIRNLQLRGAKEQELGCISVSIGVAVYPEHLPSVSRMGGILDLIHSADEALYEAKRQGRNRYVVYDKSIK